MTELQVTIDKVPGRCKVMFAISGPLVCVYAENIDTGVTGPSVYVPEDHEVKWADLDPDGLVGAS